MTGAGRQGWIWTLAALFAFAAIALAIDAGALAPLDERVLLSLREGDRADPLGPAWVEELARDVTALGGTPFAIGASVIALVYFMLRNKPASALFTLVVAGGAQSLSEGLKAIFRRPRPDLVPHEVEVYSASFPSGHALLAASLFLTAAFVRAQAEQNARIRAFTIAAAIVLTMMVAASRVYLGVHWPSDVVAGWCAGLAWALVASRAYAAWIAPNAAAL